VISSFFQAPGKHVFGTELAGLKGPERHPLCSDDTSVLA
jgi:hypothetical protein